MSNKEVNQATILNKVLKDNLSQSKAAELLGLSPRQVQRKYKRYKTGGAAALIHKGRGKHSNRRLSEDLRKKIIDASIGSYTDYGPTLIAEYLAHDHKITVDHETVRRILIEAGIHRVKKRRYKKDHIWRERKKHAGELVQMDGSTHQWFGEKYTTLMLCIDDATSRIYAQFAPESTQGAALFMADYFRIYGRPVALYVDRSSVYRVNANNTAQQTQFARMMKECDVSILHARSPQAKGRVERVFRTLQKRLCIELERNNATSIKQANTVLQKMIAMFNRTFTVKPAQPSSLFRSLKGINLSRIICYKHHRKINNGRLVKFCNKTLLINKYHQPHLVKIGSTVTIEQAFDDTITIRQKGALIQFTDISHQQPIRDETFQSQYTNHHAWQVSTKKQTFLQSFNPDISKEF